MSASTPQHVYFVGIGGIGMSALARYYRQRGILVSGYDLRPSDLTRALSSEGISVHYEDEPGGIPGDVDLAIYTPAVPSDFGELSELKRRRTKLVKRAAALGLISDSHPTLAVAGTHGKTTTSAMAAYLMREQGLDPVAFLGGIAANYGTNYLDGRGEWLVVEADEYDRSFLSLHPDVAIVTYIEPDHLDIYGERASFEQGFRDFLSQVKPGGTVITKPHIAERLASALTAVEVWTYGLETADWQARGIRVEDGGFAFELHAPGAEPLPGKSMVPGRHNVENAVAAIASVVAAGADLRQAVRDLAGFRGVARRFERLGRFKAAEVISDYAHHPTEVASAVAAARELFDGKRVIGVFQPHLYTRTRDFYRDFALALSALEEVVLLEVYPAREAPIENVSSSMIFSHITVEKKYLVHSSEAPGLLHVLNPDVLLFMGAGDVDSLARKLVQA